MKKAIYALSADPITNGHIDIINRVSKIFDELIVAIGIDSKKNYTFTLDERKALAQKALKNYKNVIVTTFKGLLVDYAYTNGISIIIRGLRNSRDFDYESELFYVNVGQNRKIDTWYIPAGMDKLHISSSAARELQRLSGMIYDYVPLIVKQALEKKISKQFIIGLTGEIASGKSYIGEKLSKILPNVHNIDLDKLGHELYTTSCPLYSQVSNDLKQEFGTLERKIIGEIVFNDLDALKKLNSILKEPILTLLRQRISKLEGIILINGTLLAEHNLGNWCNNNVIIVSIDRPNQIKALEARNLTQEQIDRRLSSQYTYTSKLKYFEDKIRKDGTGNIWKINNYCYDLEVKLEELVKKEIYKAYE